ncbi:uncharacterized protein [Prorops nasuta]|uniref:uncharacterized protein n=1 Tax=Prorops nasuta TaxID=863751 RepID=UPI0034CEEB6C
MKKLILENGVIENIPFGKDNLYPTHERMEFGNVIMIAGVMAALSMAAFGLFVYNISRLLENTFIANFWIMDCGESSLEEDLEDIIKICPTHDIRSIMDSYFKYEPQIRDTVAFIEDHKRIIFRELRDMDEVKESMEFLRSLGLDVDGWKEKIQISWKSMPSYVRREPIMADGGFTVMVSKILETLPKEELHELLCKKMRQSRSFRKFMQALKSNDFIELCSAIDANEWLQRYSFWAKEEGIEITFAIELLKNLYIYLTECIL